MLREVLRVKKLDKNISLQVYITEEGEYSIVFSTVTDVTFYKKLIKLLGELETVGVE